MINRNKKIAMSVVRAILLAIFLIAALLPLYWIFVTSIKAGTEIYTFPLKYWPDKPSLDSYRELFSFSNFGLYFRNSLLISLSAAFGAMVVSILAGFALSRLTAKRLKGAIELGMYFTQTIPTFIIMVPSSFTSRINFSGCTIIKCTSSGFSLSSATYFKTGNPKDIFGTKTPSIISICNQSASLWFIFSISSFRLAKFADKREGDIFNSFFIL